MGCFDIRYTTSPEFTLEALTKTDDGKELVKYEPPFNPYCFVKEPATKQDVVDLLEAANDAECDVDMDETHSHISGEFDVVKVTGQVPWDIKDFKRLYDEETFEADVPYTRRVMIDEEIQVDVPDEEDILYFDIEVDPRGEFPDPEEADKRILSIAWADGTGDVGCICYDNEKKLIREFYDMLDEYFVISGWNSETFDWPYLKNRRKTYGIQYDSFEVVHLDLQYLFMHVNREERESFALDAVGQDEVGMEKEMREEDHPMGYEVLWHWFENDRKTLISYNEEDAKITRAIDNKYKLTRIVFRIVRRGYMRPTSLMYNTGAGQVNMAVGSACDGATLNHNSDTVFNNKGKYDSHDFPGGRVFEPKPGTYTDVMTADFSGMYPAMIRDFNIGQRSWLDASSVDEAVEMARETFDDTITEDDIILGVGDEPDGTYETEGQLDNIGKARGYFIHPDIAESELASSLDEIESLRMEFKKKKKKASKGTDEWHKRNNQDRGLKVLSNSMFGVSASPDYHRYYVPGMSENITEMGQHLTSACKKWAEEELPLVEQVIYGDSVTGDTVTPIKDANGRIELHRFDELLDEYEFTPIGGAKDRYEPAETLYTLTRDGWNEITQLVGHAVDKSVYTCRTPRGVFSVTEDHSVVSETGEFSVSEWNDDELCAQTSPMPIMAHGDVDLGTKKRIDVAEIADTTVYDDNKRQTETSVTQDGIYVEYTYADTPNNRRRGRVDDTYKHVRIPRYIDLDETFGFVIGMFIGDGSTTEYAGAKISVSDDDIRERSYNALTTVFDEDMVTNGVNLLFANRIVSDLMKKLCGRSSETKQMPDWYLEAPKEFLLGVLQGYAHADSSKKYRTDDIERYTDFGHCGSQSRKLVSQVYFLVTNVFGVDQQRVEIGYRHEKKQYWITWNASRTKYEAGYHHRSKVRKKEVDVDYVWDLTVADDHTFIDALGGTVLHNTDSVMFELNVIDEYVDMDGFDEYVANFIEHVGPDNELDLAIDELRDCYKSIQVAQKASCKLNEFIVEYVRDVFNSPGNHMEMDLDDVYKTYLITDKKKKYAGDVVYDDGPCAYRKIKGFKCVKANTSQAVKAFQKALIEAKLNLRPTSEIIDRFYHELFTGQFDHDMVQHTRLNKMPDDYETLMAHARAAKMIIEREGDKGAIRTGDKVKYLKYGDDVTKVMPVDNGIDDFRPNEGYCDECDAVVYGDHEHDVNAYPRLRNDHYSYLWSNRFEPTMKLLQVRQFEQTTMGAFL